MTDSYQDHETKSAYSNAGQSVVQTNPLLNAPWSQWEASSVPVPPLPTSNAGPSAPRSAPGPSVSIPPYNPAHQYPPPPNDSATTSSIPPPAYTPPAIVPVGTYALPYGPPPPPMVISPYATPQQPYTYPSSPYPPQTTILVPAIPPQPVPQGTPWRYFFYGLALTFFFGPLSFIKLAMDSYTKMGLAQRKMFCWGVFAWMFLVGCVLLIFGRLFASACVDYSDGYPYNSGTNGCTFISRFFYGVGIFFYLWAVVAASLVKIYRRREWEVAAAKQQAQVQGQAHGQQVIATVPAYAVPVPVTMQPGQQVQVQYGVGAPVQMQVMGAYR